MLARRAGGGRGAAMAAVRWKGRSQVGGTHCASACRSQVCFACRALSRETQSPLPTSTISPFPVHLATHLWPPALGSPPACDSTLLTISHPLPCPFSHNILTNLTNTNITSISTSVCDPFVLLCELVKICEALSQVTGPCVV